MKHTTRHDNTMQSAAITLLSLWKKDRLGRFAGPGPESCLTGLNSAARHFKRAREQSQATDLLLLLGGRHQPRDQGQEERDFIAAELEKVRIDADKRFGMDRG